MRYLLLFLAAFPTLRGLAQEIPPITIPAYGARFQEIKTYQEQALRLGGTKSQMVEAQQTILKARYGESGTQRLFGSYSPSPSIEGISKTVRLAASDNPNQAKGYLRTLLYEKAFTTSGTFKAIATDKVVSTKLGMTDIDLVLKERLTGKMVFVEVKDNKLTGQNFQDYRLKARRLKAFADRNGGQVVFLNRRDFKPRFHKYANDLGILTFDNVTTGEKSSRSVNNMGFNKMQEALSQHLQTRANLKPQSSTMLSRPAESLRDANAGRGSSIKHVSGPDRAPTRARTAGKWLGRAGIVVSVGTEVYMIQGFATGRLSEREFVASQSGFAGGAIGAWAGAEAGAIVGGAVGVWFGGFGAAPGAAIGAFVGGISGGVAGASLGELAASGFYNRLDLKQKGEVEAFIYRRYGL